MLLEHLNTGQFWFGFQIASAFSVNSDLKPNITLLAQGKSKTRVNLHRLASYGFDKVRIDSRSVQRMVSGQGTGWLQVGKELAGSR